MITLGYILIVLTIATIVVGVAYPRLIRKKLNWESRASIIASSMFAYSAVFLGLGIWFLTIGGAENDRKMQQQALLDALTIDIRRGADACAGYLDISKKLPPGRGRVFGIIPQIQLEALLRSDIPLSARARYSTSMMIEDATLGNALISPLNPHPENRESGLHATCVLLASNRIAFEKRLSDSLQGSGLQYRPEIVKELGQYPYAES
jgi:hypothetical protein